MERQAAAINSTFQLLQKHAEKWGKRKSLPALQKNPYAWDPTWFSNPNATTALLGFSSMFMVPNTK